jgi:hypothetical protein
MKRKTHSDHGGREAFSNAEIAGLGLYAGTTVKGGGGSNRPARLTARRLSGYWRSISPMQPYGAMA